MPLFGNLTPNANIKWDSTASQLFIGGESKFLNDLYCVGDVYILSGSNSNTLQFANDVKTRKIVLYEGADNDYQFYGFGKLRKCYFSGNLSPFKISCFFF